MRQVAGSLRLDLAQYRELAAFAQFGSDLDKATQAQLNRGRRLVEILKQPQYQPLAVERQVAIVYAATKGFIDAVAIEDVLRYELELYRFLESRHPGVLTGIAEKKILDDEIKAGLESALKEFTQQFAAAARRAAERGRAGQTRPDRDAITDRPASSNSCGEIDAANHQGDEDDRGVAPEAGAGPRHRSAPVRPAHAEGVEPSRGACRGGCAPVAADPGPGERPHAAHRDHRRSRVERELQLQRDQGCQPVHRRRGGTPGGARVDRPQGPRFLPAPQLRRASTSRSASSSA